MSLSLDFLSQFIPGTRVIHSKELFQDISFFQHINFIGITTVDNFVDTSFEIPYVNGNIRGALVRTFTKDNTISEEFICYEIPLTHKFETKQQLSMKLHNLSNMVYTNIRDMVKSTPWISMIVFNLLLLLLPANISTFFTVINIIALVVVGFYYLGASIRFVFRFFRSKNLKLLGQSINYEDEDDLRIISNTEIITLLKLKPRLIDSIVFFQKKLYLKQDIVDKSLLSTMRTLRLTSTEKEKIIMESIQNALNFIYSEEFKQTFTLVSENESTGTI